MSREPAGSFAAYPGLSGRRLWREIAELGYCGGDTAVTDFLREACPPWRAGFELRFETPPGRQAQADFAQFKVTFDDEPGRTRAVWLFSMILAHSRWLWGRFCAGRTRRPCCAAKSPTAAAPICSSNSSTPEDQLHMVGRPRSSFSCMTSSKKRRPWTGRSNTWVGANSACSLFLLGLILNDGHACIRIGRDVSRLQNL